MERDTKRGLLIVIIVLLAIIAIALAGIFGLMLFRQSSIGIDLGIDDRYPTVMTRNEENKYEAYKIELVAGTVDISNSLDGQVHYSIQANEKKLSVSEKDGVLVIIDKSGNKGNFGVTKNKLVNNKTSHISLEIPSDFSGSFEIKSNAGNINLASFPEATLNADADAGELNVDKIKNIKANCAAGDIKINEITNSVDVSANAGNINIDFADIKENSRLDCNFGNVVVKDLSDIKVNANCDLGNKSVRKSGDSSAITLDVSVNCGNIEIG